MGAVITTTNGQNRNRHLLRAIFRRYVLGGDHPQIVIAGLDPATHAGVQYDEPVLKRPVPGEASWATGSSPVVTS